MSIEATSKQDVQQMIVDFHAKQVSTQKKVWITLIVVGSIALTAAILAGIGLFAPKTAFGSAITEVFGKECCYFTFVIGTAFAYPVFMGSLRLHNLKLNKNDIKKWSECISRLNRGEYEKFHYSLGLGTILETLKVVKHTDGTIEILDGSSLKPFLLGYKKR